jgi:hypothetical protein
MLRFSYSAQPSFTSHCPASTLTPALLLPATLCTPLQSPAPNQQVKAEIAKYKVGAPARVGLVAPNDVTIPAGGTGMDPSQTSFFQALAIATKINKGEQLLAVLLLLLLVGL